jgi:hypothetical protein
MKTGDNVYFYERPTLYEDGIVQRQTFVSDCYFVRVKSGEYESEKVGSRGWTVFSQRAELREAISEDIMHLQRVLKSMEAEHE